jgi:hypothetical protein
MIYFQKLNGWIVNRGDLLIAMVTWLPVIWEKELFRWVCNDYAPKALGISRCCTSIYLKWLRNIMKIFRIACVLPEMRTGHFQEVRSPLTWASVFRFSKKTRIVWNFCQSPHVEQNVHYFIINSSLSSINTKYRIRERYTFNSRRVSLQNLVHGLRW